MAPAYSAEGVRRRDGRCLWFESAELRVSDQKQPAHEVRMGFEAFHQRVLVVDRLLERHVEQAARKRSLM
jgi:hypothetical protein